MFSIVGNSICVKIFRNVSDEEVGWESRIVPIPQKKWSKEKQRFFFALLMPHICRYSRAPLWDMQSNSANLLWESLWMFLGGLGKKKKEERKGKGNEERGIKGAGGGKEVRRKKRRKDKEKKSSRFLHTDFVLGPSFSAQPGHLLLCLSFTSCLCWALNQPEVKAYGLFSSFLTVHTALDTCVTF